MFTVLLYNWVLQTSWCINGNVTYKLLQLHYYSKIHQHQNSKYSYKLIYAYKTSFYVSHCYNTCIWKTPYNHPCPGFMCTHFGYDVYQHTRDNLPNIGRLTCWHYHMQIAQSCYTKGQINWHCHMQWLILLQKAWPS